MRLLLTGLLVASSTSVMAVEDLNIPKFVDLLKEHDPGYKTIFADEKSAAYIVEQGLPTSQVLLSLQQENGYTSSQGNTSDFTTSLSKDVIQTGTSVSVSYNKSKQVGTKVNLTQLRVEQSLYNNALGRDNRLQRESLEEQRDYTLMQVQENYEDYLEENLSTFLDFQQAYLNMKSTERIYKEAKKLQGNISKRYKSNVATKTDYDRGSLLVLEREEDYLDAQRNYALAKKNILTLVGNSVADIRPQQDSEMIPILEDLVAKADLIEGDKTRNFLIAHITESSKDKEYTLAKRANDPTVNLIAGFNRDESERYNATANRNEAVVGVSVDIPLFDDQQEATTATVGVEKYKAQLVKRQALITFRNNITDLKDKMKNLKSRVRIGRKKIEVTESILKQEKRRYEIGKIDLETLIDTVNDYATTQQQLNENEMTYAKSLVEWLSLNDQLIASAKRR